MAEWFRALVLKSRGPRFKTSCVPLYLIITAFNSQPRNVSKSLENRISLRSVSTLLSLVVALNQTIIIIDYEYFFWKFASLQL